MNTVDSGLVISEWRTIFS